MRTHRPLAESLESRRLLDANVAVDFALDSAYHAGDAIDGSDFIVYLSYDSDSIKAGQFTYKVILASDEAGTKDVAVIASGDVPALTVYDGDEATADGSQATLDFNYVLPASLAGKTRYVILSVDGDTPEYYAYDDRLSAPISIVAAGDPLPADLSVYGYYVNYLRPGDTISGESVYVYNNDRSTTAGEFTYDVILASDEAGTKDVVTVATGDVPAINFDESGSLDFEYVVPSTLAGKTHYVIVTLHSSVPELDGEDNRSSSLLRVAATLDDATIVGADGVDTFAVSPSYVDAGEFVVERTGDVPEGESGIWIGRYADFPSLTFDLRGGNDTVYSNTVPLNVLGGAGNDTVYGSPGRDTLDGGAGDDFVQAGGGDDLLAGGTGDDTLRGDAGMDTLDGGDGGDVLEGGRGEDRLLGGGGNDQIAGGDDGDSIDAGDGDDYVRGEGRNYEENLAGNDTIAGGAGRDTLHGDDGNDRISGGAGGDSLNGGAGNDTLFGQGGRDHLRGAGGDDHLYGGAGADVLHALEGPEGGVDTLSGGTGHDAARVDASDLLASIEVRTA